MILNIANDKNTPSVCKDNTTDCDIWNRRNGYRNLVQFPWRRSETGMVQQRIQYNRPALVTLKTKTPCALPIARREKKGSNARSSTLAALERSLKSWTMNFDFEDDDLA
jgi:hypothetical protein